MKIHKIFMTLLLISFTPLSVWANEIAYVHANVSSQEISASAQFKLSTKNMQEISEGLSKEYIVYFDLFRVWQFWPDEFITSKKFVININANPITQELVASRFDGTVIREKRFKDISSMVAWALIFENVKISHIGSLESGKYYIRVSVESYVRKLPPVLGYMLFFVPEKEMSISSDSNVFSINSRGDR